MVFQVIIFMRFYQASHLDKYTKLGIATEADTHSMGGGIEQGLGQGQADFYSPTLYGAGRRGSVPPTHSLIHPLPKF